MDWAKDKIAENILPCPLHLNLFWLIIIFFYEFSYIVDNTFTEGDKLNCSQNRPIRVTKSFFIELLSIPERRTSPVLIASNCEFWNLRCFFSVLI